MRKIFFSLFISLLIPTTVFAFNVQNSIDYVAALPQNHATTRALRAAGVLPSDIDIDYLSDVSSFSQDNVATLAGNILAIIAIGENPYNYASNDYISLLKSFEQAGQLGTLDCPWVGGVCTNDDIWGAMALVAAGEDVNSSLLQNIKSFLLSSQNQDSGWGASTTSISDTDSTASAVMALLELGVDQNGAIIQNAIQYIYQQIAADGGFSCGEASWCKNENGELVSNPDTSSWVISLLYKIGDRPTQEVEYLQSQQQADGSIGFTTGYGIVALLEKYYPLFYYEPPAPAPILASPGSIFPPTVSSPSPPSPPLPPAQSSSPQLSVDPEPQPSQEPEPKSEPEFQFQVEQETLPYPDNSLIRSSDNSVYLIENNRKRWIPHHAILETRFGNSIIEAVEDDVLDMYSEGLAVTFPDGVYLRSQMDHKIYYISNQKKYHVLALKTWQSLALKGAEFINVEETLLLPFLLGGIVF